jgi:hypothetical protein
MPGAPDDFLHKHDRTFVVLDDGDIATIRGVGVDGTYINLQKENGNILYWKFLEKPAPFKQIQRKRKIFNHNTALLMVTNNPERKYRIGLCSSTVTVQSVTTGRPMNLEHSIVASMVKDAYVSLEDAVKSHHPVAVSEKWGVLKILKNNEPGHILSYENTPVGIINDESVTIANVLFEEECRDFLRSIDSNMKIKVKNYDKSKNHL